MGRGRKKKNFTFKNSKGVTYEVIFRKPNKQHYGNECDGICYDPDEKPKPKIMISPYLTDQSEINTCIHEIAHAFFWEETETNITKFANVCSRFLFNEMKWRKPEDES